MAAALAAFPGATVRRSESTPEALAAQLDEPPEPESDELPADWLGGGYPA